MIKVLINGINGKMGQMLVNKISSDEELSVVCGIDIQENPEFPVYQNPADIREECDLIIDFSVPQATLEILAYAETKKLPIVIGTTGFSPEENEIIKIYSGHLPIFKSANMSFQVNLLTKLLIEIAPQLPAADIEIVETHHNRKKDAPSGTALMLAAKINEAMDNTMTYTFDRHGESRPRNKNEIGIHSIRGGAIVGKHTVMFIGEDETLEISHSADSKAIFADGAIKAAKFIIAKPNGLYDMNDLLESK